jgi:hypothetical protein
VDSVSVRFQVINGLVGSLSSKSLSSAFGEKTMTIEAVNLMAAIVAALAALFSAFVASKTALRVAKETAHAEETRELSSFRRERLAYLRDILFESAVALEAFRTTCRHVPWLANTPIEHITQRGTDTIACLKYAFEALRAMNAKGTGESGPIYLLGRYFERLIGSLTQYKDMIDIGHIEHSAQVAESALDVQKRSIEVSAEWGKTISKLREFVAALYSTH